MTYVLSCDGEEHLLSSSETIERRLLEMECRDAGEVWLTQRLGERQGLERVFNRVLGVGNQIDGGSVGVVFDGNEAFVVFVDDAGDEFVALDPAALPRAGSREFRLATGDTSWVSAADCVDRRLGFAALRHFHRTGGRLEGLRWRRTE